MLTRALSSGRPRDRGALTGAVLVPVLALVLAVVPALLGAVPAEAAATAVVSGRVVDDQGAPLRGIAVSVDAEDDWGSATTASDGTWSVRGLGAGSFTVHFDDPAEEYVSEYWDDAVTWADATRVAVADGAVVRLGDTGLALGAHLTGTVTGPAHQGLGGIRVLALPQDEDGEPGAGELAQATTDPAGHYDLAGLAAGSYLVLADDDSGTWLTQLYDGSATSPTGGVAVTTGQRRAGIDLELAPASRLSGVLTDATRAPLADVEVTVFEQVDGAWEPVAFGYSGDDGRWTVGGLPAGTYRVGFAVYDWDEEDDLSLLAEEFYDDAATLAAATDVRLRPASSTSGIDASLALPTGSGPVLPPAPPVVVPTLPGTTLPAAPAPLVLRAPRASRVGLFVGKRAKVVVGSYAPGTTVTYAWYADGRAVKGAHRSTLRLTAKQRGAKLSVLVTATGPGAAPVATRLTFAQRVR